MEKTNRKKLPVVLVFLVLALAALTVAFAALSTTLTINGKARLQGDPTDTNNNPDWYIHFDNIGNANDPDGVAVLSAPLIKTGDNTTIEGLSLLFTKAATYEFQFDIKNEGTLAAKIGTISGLSPAGNHDLVYTLTYVSGGGALAVNDQL
ncbi:MAG: hypothetical protein LBM78_02610, partial [Clostridiales bacterium]|nr:hypothetical protein [Clostridiales bacterium]